MKLDYFIFENKVEDSAVTVWSPSGHFLLTVTEYRTRQGCWNYTQGVVVRCADRRVVAIINRNYSTFWHCFAVVGTHEYLLCGEDYQGQTVINLTIEKRVDYTPPEAQRGIGFCWISCEQFDLTRLRVIGCYWAFPEEEVIVNFERPLVLPYPIISRRWLEDESDADA